MQNNLEVANVEKTSKKSRNIKKLKDYTFCYGMLFYPLFLFAIFYIYVNFQSILMAFQHFSIDGSKTFVGFDNFSVFLKKVFSSEDILGRGIINSLKYWVLSTIISYPLNIFFSYLIFKKCKGRTVIKFFFMLPTVISGFVYTMLFKQFGGVTFQDVMIRLGFENFPNLLGDSRYVFGTVLFFDIWISFSSSLIIFPNAMNAIDNGVIESAQLDGASNMLQELFYIILPQIYPTLTTFIVLSIAGILGGSGSLIPLFNYSAPAEVYSYGYYYSVQILTASNDIGYPLLAAGGLLGTLVIAPLTMLVRHLMEKYSPLND